MDEFIALMNRYGAEKVPFLFIIDFDMKYPEIYKLDEVPDGLKFVTPLHSNVSLVKQLSGPVSLKRYPVSYSAYSNAFVNVHKNICMGNSYLLNLTFTTLIETELTLEEIFYTSIAKYKLLYNNKFVVFSPEIFVRINNGQIKAFPMKGTIDSSVPDAENVILNDEKEAAEHNTIIDLIRNDLSKIADGVKVTRYRYIERIKSGSTELLQVSSEISGRLSEGFEYNFGDILKEMLPAVSVTGAPKKETVRIIKESENYDRGWYTGIFGVFDGKDLDSAVMIRFIEKSDGQMLFKSGGGITYLSDPVKEYEELISKVYVPIG